MYRLILVATLFVALFTPVLGQRIDDFSGGIDTLASGDRLLWKPATPIGATSAGTMRLDANGNAIPYHTGGQNNYGYIYYDSLITPPASGYVEGFVVLSQKGGTNNIRTFAIGAIPTKNWVTGYGYFAAMQEMAGATQDYITIRRPDYGFSSLSGTYPSDWGAVSKYIVNEHAVGDTIGFMITASNAFGAWYRDNSGFMNRDTIWTYAAQSNFASGFYVYIGGQVDSAVPLMITSFGIRSSGAAPPPPSDASPPQASISLSDMTPIVGQTIWPQVTLSDDSALSAFAVHWGTAPVWNEYGSALPGGGTLKTYSSGNFGSGYAPTQTGPITFRVIASDGAAKYDTAEVTVQVADSAGSSGFNKRVFVWATFDDTKWSPTSPGNVPADSLPWAATTHVGIFAANGANPPQTYYTDQIAPAVAYCRTKNVEVGLTIGGEGDAALVSIINTGTAAQKAAWIRTYMTYIDQGLHFLDFDFEGSYDAALRAAFIQQVYDSLQTRTHSYDPTRKPYLVLTVGVMTAISMQAQQNLFEFMNIMTYDYAYESGGSTWGRIIHDNFVKSKQYYNNTGTIIDFLAGQGVNSEGPSMQRIAERANAAGWPYDKISVGIDFNPTYWYSTAAGRGPLYVGQLNFPGLSSKGSTLNFYNQWAKINSLPADSIKYDTLRDAYYAHIGNGTPSDTLWNFFALPGRDQAVAAARKVVDSMGLGGVCVWNVGDEIWNATVVPAQGRGWHMRQIDAHFSGTAAPPPTLPPPSTFTPANGAVNVATSFTYDWNDVATAAAYHLQISTVGDFTSSVLNDTAVAASQRSVSGLTNNRTYYARIRTKGGDGRWGGWATQSWTTIAGAPTAPSITSPVNNSTQPGNTVLVRWNPGSNPPTTWDASNFYQLQVGLDVGFGTIVLQDSSQTMTQSLSRLLTGLANSTGHHLRVRAKTFAGYSAWSSVISFTTGAAPPEKVVLSSPSNGATQLDTALTFSWAFSNNASQYRLQVGTNSTFSSIVYDTYTALLSHYRSGFAKNTTYAWRVKAIGVSDSADWSSAYTFTTTGTAPPPPPRYTVQMAYWYDVTTGRTVQKRPAPWLVYAWSQQDMSDVPAPPAGMIAWSPWGIKTADTTLLFAFQQSEESLSGIFSGEVGAWTPNLYDPNLSSTVKIVPDSTNIGTIRLTAGKRSGTIATVLSLEDHVMRSLTLMTQLGPASGGLGTSPSLQTGSPFAWGWDPAVPGGWTKFTDLSKFGVYSTVGSPVSVVPYIGSDGSWKTKDSASAFGGSGTNLGDVTGDTIRANVYHKPAADTGISWYYDQTGVVNGSISGDGVAFGVKAAGSSIPGTVQASDGSGIYAYTQRGTEITQYTVDERITRLRGVTPTDDVELHVWPHNDTTQNTSSLRAIGAIPFDGTYLGVDYSVWNVSYAIDVEVTASRTDTTDGDGYGYYKRRCLVRNDGGVVNIYGEQTEGTDIESDAANMDVDLSIVSGDLTVSAKGATDQTFTWHVLIYVRPLRN